MADKETKTILFATHNHGKALEMNAMLAPLGFRVITADKLGLDMSQAKETADTFKGNSLIKARYAYRMIRGAYPVLADDSGICFTGLGGFPGVHSARWTVDGDSSYLAKNNKILEFLKGNPDRGALFECVLTLIDDKGEHIFSGECRGRVADRPSQAKNGFGYDPIFFCPEIGKTFADATTQEKDGVSHRGKAVKLLLDYLGKAK